MKPPSKRTALLKIISFVVVGQMIFSFFPQVFWNVIPDLPFLKGPGKGAFISVVLLVIVSYLFLKSDRSSFKELGVDRIMRFKQLGFGILAGVAMNAISAFMLAWMFNFEWKINVNFNMGIILLGLLLNCWSVIAEELLYRGYAFKRSVKQFGTPVSLIIFILFFVVFHWFAWGVISNPMRMLSVFITVGLGGLLFSVAFLRTGSLALPAGLHLGIIWANADLFTGMFARWYDNKQGLFYPINTTHVDIMWQKSWLLINIPYIFVCILAIAAIWFCGRKNKSVTGAASVDV